MAFPVTLNGTTYTLADFEGLNYVDGFPDALEDFVTEAAAQVTAAENAKNAAEAALDSFDDRFLGSKTSDPTLDNDGNALTDGALYFDTTNNVMKVYDLGNTEWKQTTPTTSQQANIDTVAANDANITTVATNDSNITTVAGISSNVTTVAGISANVTTVAGNDTNISTVAAADANITTVATNIGDVNSFAEVYRIASSEPSTSLGEGDLYFDTTTDKVRVYNGSAWQDVAPTATSITASQISDVTSTAAELNLLDGVTATTAELNLLDGVTATTTELNLLDGVTATTAEINHLDGATSNIQTQIDAIGSAAWTKLAEVNASGASNVDITGTTDGYKMIKFLFAGLKFSSGAPILIRLINSSGTVQTSSVHGYAGNYHRDTTTGNQANSGRDHWAASLGQSVEHDFSGHLRVSGIASGSKTVGEILIGSGTSTRDAMHFKVGITTSNTDQFGGIRIYSGTSATLTGTVKMYGLN